MEPVLEVIRDILNTPVYQTAESVIRLSTILSILMLTIILIYVSGKIRSWTVQILSKRSNADLGVRQAIGSIVRYITIILGLFVIVQAVGIDLSSFAVIAGALGIGVGLGLQNITNNIVSGLIILIERPIKVGDRVEVGEITGDVIDISPRSTTIITNDNISIIVPNADFITSNVINWSHNDRSVRVHVPVSVIYGTDAELVRKVLLNVAAQHDGVLEKPSPDVIFSEFGESSLNFDLRVFTQDYTTKPQVLRSDLNFIIQRDLKAAGIEVPYPQRDLHVRSGEITVKMKSGE